MEEHGDLLKLQAEEHGDFLKLQVEEHGDLPKPQAEEHGDLLKLRVEAWGSSGTAGKKAWGPSETNQRSSCSEAPLRTSPSRTPYRSVPSRKPNERSSRPIPHDPIPNYRKKPSPVPEVRQVSAFPSVWSLSTARKVTKKLTDNFVNYVFSFEKYKIKSILFFKKKDILKILRI